MTDQVSDRMRAWVVREPGAIDSRPLELVSAPTPQAAPDELLVKVEVCGVCRTDLHLAEGDLPPRRSGVVPGHQVVGTVVDAGPQARERIGHRVGIAWLRRACGVCRWCRGGRENLCPDSHYTGWDADGGFAEYAAVPAGFAYPLPDELDPVQAAPLLCAGIIGYRSLLRAELPPGGRLGIYGFGSSAHITAQIALRQGAELYVATRGEANRALARELGAAWVGDAADRPPVPSTPRSCSRPRANSSRSRSRRSIAVARWPAPASTCPPSRPWTTPVTCSRSATCAPSPRTRDATARSCSPSRRG